MNADAGPLQVLVVDDDAGDAALVPTIVHRVEDGADALAFLRREDGYAGAPRPDLILLDLNMPRVDGRRALAEIKTDPQLKAIPVVVFSASATPEDVLRSYAAHANAFVAKPGDLEEFERVLAEIRAFFGHTATLPPTREGGAGLS
jgi:CheY-like chemotaxis protein